MDNEQSQVTGRKTWVIAWKCKEGCNWPKGEIHVTDRLTARQALSRWVTAREVGQVVYLVSCASSWYRLHSVTEGR